MMKFVALVWDPKNETQANYAGTLKGRLLRQSAELPTVLDQPGLFVCAAPEGTRSIARVYVLPSGRGVILGRLFERAYVDSYEDGDGPPRAVSFGEPTSSRIIRDRGDTLTKEYWGCYIACITDSASGKSWIIRDPTGKIPCQEVTAGGVGIYFSRIEDLLTIENIPLQISRHYVIGTVTFGRNRFSSEAGYAGVSTVLPGERVEHGALVKRDFCWNIVEFGNSEMNANPTSARIETRRVVRSCVHAWASCLESISFQLSGGVDSSILAACLASAPTRPRISCVNFYSRHETSDERIFAREVAACCGLELIEVSAEESGEIDLSPPSMTTVVPIQIERRKNIWGKIWDMLASRGVAGHMRGDGGDELFFRGGSLPDAVDFAYRHGLTRGLWRVAWNDALIERMSVWEVLGLALRYGRMKRAYDWRRLEELRPRMSWPLEEGIWDDAVRDLTHLHPLFRGSVDCPPCKLEQAFSFQRFIQAFYTGPKGHNEPDVFAPLMSQPHMEFALRTPASILRFGGRDRAMARAAFADEIPASIANRRFKGLSTPRFSNWVGGQAALVREYLLDGYLVSERILDRKAVERMLAKSDSRWASSSANLMLYMCIEVWARGATQRGEMAA